MQFHRCRMEMLIVLTTFALPVLAHDTDSPVCLPRVDPEVPLLRLPVDLDCRNDELFVANSRSGTVSALDTASGRLTAEWKVSASVSGLKFLGDSLLILDDSTHQLLHILPQENREWLQVQQTIPLPAYPVALQVSPGQSTVAVSSLWSRRLTLLQADEQRRLTISSTVDLKFAPRSLLFLSEQVLVVADSFGGRLAIVNTSSGSVVGYRQINGHNIRGLGLSHDGTALLVTCQSLNSEAFISYERVFWGVVMQNGMQTVPLSELTAITDDPQNFGTDSDSDSGSGAATGSAYTNNSPYVSNAAYGRRPAYGLTPRSDRRVYPLGTPSIGSGDPGPLLVTGTDTTLVLLGGVHQAAFRTASHLPFSRLPTGHRPEAICLDESEQRAFIANRFDDTVTIISLTGEQPSVERTVALGAIRERTPEEQGEQLFYDATLSLDGWYSCHSCHSDGHTNGMLSDTLGDEGQGAPKKVLSLLGTADTGPWAWNGSKSTLEQQIHTSLLMSMQSQLSSEQLPVAELSAFVSSLPPAPAVQMTRQEMPQPKQLLAGRKLFTSAGCSQCHAGDTLTSAEIHDVGIHDEVDGREFNPPSLRGVSQRAPYFHDGRAAVLRDVLRSGHHGSSLPLTDDEMDALEILLNTL